MSFLLKITAGTDAGNEFTLRDGKNMIGRSRSADVRVYNEDVSGKHFLIEVADGSAKLQNISSYGTRVDGILVHQSVELCSGQVIEAGKTLKFIFEATENDAAADAEGGEPELTGVTKFVGDVQNDSSGDMTNPGEETAVTRFANEAEQTSVTKFASDQPEEDVNEAEQTSVTKFVSDLPEEEEVRESIEETSATKFASDLPEEGEFHESIEETSITRFAAELPEDAAGNSESGRADDADATAAGTVIGFIKPDISAEAANETVEETGAQLTMAEETSSGTPSRTFFTADSGEAADRTIGEEDDNPFEDNGMFFDAEDSDESEKTNANETQVVQTRMASMEEINFIKEQIKKQQQSRLFFKFLIFCLFVVLLGVIWMLKAPEQEKVLAWPQKKEGNSTIYLTDRVPAFGLSYEKGGFDIYFPQWANAKTVTPDPNTVEIHTFLGRNGEVPLIVTVQREISDEFVYENRNNALQNMLRRLSERKNEQFNFDSTPSTGFLTPGYGESENGILYDKLAYQRDSGRSFFGVLHFFRFERTNYIIRAEVPAEEKLRALPILNSDTFVVIHPDFVRRHWEGSDEYTKGDIARIIVGIKDELLRDSPMQYPRLEREIKSILAQTVYEKNKELYFEARTLLTQLRARQQKWYQGQKIRWISAVRENDNAEKMKVRNDCEAVFSVTGDKRRYDILRDHWE